jgi:hypothetical protein
MQIELVKALIERGVINDSTCIVADCPVMVMGGMPADIELTLTVDRVQILDGTIRIYASNQEGRKYNVPAHNIKSIDGMDPIRLAAAYDIKPDGHRGISGKKRGRKPKINNV